MKTLATSTTTGHYKLTTNQLHYLKLIYKFRFITIPLVNTYKHLDQDTSRVTLQRLVEQTYLGGHYDSTYRLRGRPDAYLQYVESPEADMQPYFLEYMSTSKPLTAYLGRLRQYIYYAEDYLWNDSGIIPTILIVCETAGRAKHLYNDDRTTAEQ